MNDIATIKQSDMVLNVVNQGGDGRWYTAMLMCENGNHQGAANLVNEILCDPEADNYRSIISQWTYLSRNELPVVQELNTKDTKSIDGTMIYTVITAIGNTSAFKNDFTGNVVAMLKKAVDIGAQILAYNVANALMIWAKTPDDFSEAERYFNIVINNSLDRSEKAAAIVNSAVIVRDGLITGKKDYAEAIRLYEQAGELGQVTGMFNAANVSSWLAHKGDVKYYAHMEYWLQRMLDRVGGGVPLLDSDNHPGLDSMINNARIMLGQLNIFGKASNPKPIYGILLYRMVTSWGCYDPRRDYDIAYSHKIAQLSRPANEKAIDCWSYVLDAMDWRIGHLNNFDGNMGTIEIVLDEEESISLIVLNNQILGEELNKITPYLNEFVGRMKGHGLNRYLITQNVAMYYDHGGQIYTPIIAVNGSGARIISIYPGMTTKELTSAIEGTTPFIDGVSYSSTAALPIAINLLQGGGSVIDNAGNAISISKIGVWSVPHGLNLTN